ELTVAGKQFIETSNRAIEIIQTFNQKTRQEVTMLRGLSDPSLAPILQRIDKMLVAQTEAVRAWQTSLASFETWVQQGFPSSAPDSEAFEKDYNARLDAITGWFKTTTQLRKNIHLELRRIDAARAKTPPAALAGDWSGSYTQPMDGRSVEVYFQAH